MYKQIFPTILILLQIGAGFGYIPFLKDSTECCRHSIGGWLSIGLRRCLTWL